LASRYLASGAPATRRRDLGGTLVSAALTHPLVKALQV